MVDPQVNELVQALGFDPKEPPELTLLNGFFGPSVDEKANIRLYRSVLMNVWQDIPRDQIIHIDKIERSPETPFGEDVVWMLRRDARALDPQMVVRPADESPQQPVAPLQQPGAALQQPGAALQQPGAAPAAGTDDGDGFGDGDYNGWHRMWPPK